MVKIYSRGAKRRAKKGLPDLAEVPKKQPNGRTRRPSGHIGEKRPEKTVLVARARHSGKPVDDLAEMRKAALGEPAGLAIYAAHEGEAAQRLWDAYKGFTAAEAIYAKHYLGMRLHAKTSQVDYLVETFEARPDDHPDLRDEEQRSRDASNNWMLWRGRMMQISLTESRAISDVAYGRTEPMVEGKLTTSGRRFVDAVQCLANVVDRS